MWRRRLIGTALGLAALALLAPVAGAAEMMAPPKPAKVTLQLRDTPFRAALKALFEGTGREYRVEPEVSDAPVSVSVRDADFNSTARLLVRLAKVKTRLDGKTVVFFTDEKPAKPVAEADAPGDKQSTSPEGGRPVAGAAPGAGTGTGLAGGAAGSTGDGPGSPGAPDPAEQSGADNRDFEPPYFEDPYTPGGFPEDPRFGRNNNREVGPRPTLGDGSQANKPRGQQEPGPRQLKPGETGYRPQPNEQFPNFQYKNGPFVKSGGYDQRFKRHEWVLPPTPRGAVRSQGGRRRVLNTPAPTHFRPIAAGVRPGQPGQKQTGARPGTPGRTNPGAGFGGGYSPY